MQAESCECPSRECSGISMSSDGLACNNAEHQVPSSVLHAGPGNSDLTGGWLNGGPAGNLKMTMPTAFTVSVLSWSMLAFPDGYSQANASSDTMSTIK